MPSGKTINVSTFGPFKLTMEPGANRDFATMSVSKE